MKLDPRGGERDSSFPWETAEPAYGGSLRRCLVCGRSSSADSWFQRKAEKLEGARSVAVGRMEGESRSRMVQRTAQGSKGTEQSWLQLWVTELKVQPSTEEHNGFVQGKELGLNHYLCFFFFLITVRFTCRWISSFHSNGTGLFFTLKDVWWSLGCSVWGKD